MKGRRTQRLVAVLSMVEADHFRAALGANTDKVGPFITEIITEQYVIAVGDRVHY